LLGKANQKVEIVQAIATLAHTLGMDVVAEGVETAQQLELLRAMQCEYGQGYFFSQPLDARAAEALITAAEQW
jgi:EAL domain-containing protein (putative c-di-GMP-specific phosphodiesterase class I)